MHASTFTAALLVAMAAVLAGCDRKPTTPPKPTMGAAPSAGAMQTPASAGG